MKIIFAAIVNIMDVTEARTAIQYVTSGQFQSLYWKNLWKKEIKDNVNSKINYNLN